MNSIFVLVPITFLLLFVAVMAWLWSVRNDQFEDLDSEGERILFDSDPEFGVDRCSKSVDVDKDVR